MLCTPVTKLPFNVKQAITFIAVRIITELISIQGVIYFLQLVAQRKIYLLLEDSWNFRLLNRAPKYWEELKKGVAEFVM